MKTLLNLFLIVLSLSASYAQVGINADNSAPHSSAILDVKSTTKAFYPPRMTTTDKNGLAGKQAGAVVFDVTLNQLSFYNGSAWVAASGSGLTLPYDQSQSEATGFNSGLFKLTNTSTGEAVAINASVTSVNGIAIRGTSQNNSPQLNSAGIFGENLSTSLKGQGVAGLHHGNGEGVQGVAHSG